MILENEQSPYSDFTPSPPKPKQRNSSKVSKYCRAYLHSDHCNVYIGIYITMCI